MSQNDEPRWPSADEDGSSGDGGATARLPHAKADPGATDALPVPNVTAPQTNLTPEDGAGSWFRPVVAPEPLPAPGTPPPATPPAAPRRPRDLADRLGHTSDPGPAEQAAQRRPEQEPPGKSEENTQQLPVRPATPWVPIERATPFAEEPGPRASQPSGSSRPPGPQSSAAQSSNPQQSQQSQQSRPEPSPARQREAEDAAAEADTVWAQRVDLRETPGERHPAEATEYLRGLPPEPPRGAVPPPASSATLARPMRIGPGGEQAPAEATTGAEAAGEPAAVPPPEPPSPEQAAAAEPPRKRRRGLLIGALVVVVLLVAAGVTATRPSIANRFGFPWAPNAPKAAMPEPAVAKAALRGPSTSGAAPTPEAIQSALAGPAGSAALGTLTGSVIDPATGTVLWDRNSGQPLTPASTTKVLTVAAALLALGHEKQLSTKIVQGAEPGTVILVAGGDVTLTTLPLGTDSPLYPGAAHVDDLVAQVKKVAGNDVKKVQVDLNAFKGPATAPGWDPTDAPSTFAAQVAPVMADGGRTDPKNDLAMRTANPATALTQLIAQKLSASAGGPATAPADAKVLAEVKSAPLTELTYDLLQLSDNLLADAVARQVAIEKGTEPSFSGAAAATLKVLQEHGFDTTGVQLSDNSGLSVQNKIPAKLLAQVLTRAAEPDGKNPDTAKLRPLLTGLPVAGGSGTLAGRYGKPDSAKGKGWVRAKTGTLSEVNTLAGYVLDADGRVLVFALMSKGSDDKPGKAALDVVAATLRTCGCH
ncbi:D-alanyl-D-alanine carboxypeptidase/D-alanyl-D-alanine endopeptidase [Amycolatopsis samaneae]|uniref:D-alanyl-D-alanine carboxypeptidase/D-alanyl-D-alanine-endopeptidase n=1 Tax=Amycolatopsis samaneae TaxID=664691 RepID=A0ABW5GJK7_9PSEU